MALFSRLNYFLVCCKDCTEEILSGWQFAEEPSLVFPSAFWIILPLHLWPERLRLTVGSSPQKFFGGFLKRRKCEVCCWGQWWGSTEDALYPTEGAVTAHWTLHGNVTRHPYLWPATFKPQYFNHKHNFNMIDIEFILTYLGYSACYTSWWY